ncbi:hypothetical protein HHX47_DHR4000239, partial [Lentinula edodes]
FRISRTKAFNLESSAGRPIRWRHNAFGVSLVFVLDDKVVSHALQAISLQFGCIVYTNPNQCQRSKPD